uniref:Nuclear Hormone Receptor family n=1 Tax=Strongyloides papillosus TaxID=174720 RepID=A0A0N5B2T5_STREA
MSNTIFLKGESNCAVCSDKATGVHYGVLSCNGCKTFFRRSIVKNKNYVCLGVEDCDVSKAGRCSCQFCRLKKCITVGMNKSAIQNCRDKIGYTKRNVKKRCTNNEPDDKNITNDYCGFQIENDSSDMPGFTQESIKIFKANFRKLKKLEDTFTLLLTRASLEAYPNLNVGINSPSIFARPVDVTYSHPIVQPTMSDEKYKVPFWRSRIITLYVDWAKTFKAFNKLPYSDKISLIVNHAPSYIAMCEAFRTPNHISDKIEHPDGHSFTHNFPEVFKINPNLNTLTPAMKLVFNFICKPFRKLKITTTEFAILQSIMLFDPDTVNLGFASQRNIMAEQKKHINTLLYYISKCYADEDVANQRFGDIILRIPTIRKVAIKISESLEFTDMFQCYKISSIVKETSMPDHINIV